MHLPYRAVHATKGGYSLSQVQSPLVCLCYVDCNDCLVYVVCYVIYVFGCLFLFTHTGRFMTPRVAIVCLYIYIYIYIYTLYIYIYMYVYSYLYIYLSLSLYIYICIYIYIYICISLSLSIYIYICICHRYLAPRPSPVFRGSECNEC